jgi:hypothetical protein
VPNKRPVPRITIPRLREWDACYEPDEIAAVFGRRKALSPFEICALDIPASDRLWVLLRPAIIPENELHALGIKFVMAPLPGPKVRTRGVAAHRRRVLALLSVKRKWMRGKLSDHQLRCARLEFEQASRDAGDFDPLARYFVCRAAIKACEPNPRAASYLAASDARHGWHVPKARTKPTARTRAEAQLAQVRKVLVRLYGEPKVKQRTSNGA